MKHLLKRIAQDTGGVAALEFAFIAPAFILMTTGAIDMGYVQLAQSQLQGATQHAARTIIQSNSGTTAERKAVVVNKITGMMADFNKRSGKSMLVTIRKFSNFSSVKNPEPFTDSNYNGRWDLGEPYTDSNANSKFDDYGAVDDLGSVGDVVKIDVKYPLDPLFSYNGAFFGVNGAIDIKATAVFRNEPE